MGASVLAASAGGGALEPLSEMMMGSGPVASEGIPEIVGGAGPTKTVGPGPQPLATTMGGVGAKLTNNPLSKPVAFKMRFWAMTPEPLASILRLSEMRTAVPSVRFA